MNLLQRAKALQKLAFLSPDENLKSLVAAAEAGPIPSDDAPATAILLATGRLLEIPPDAIIGVDEVRQLFNALDLIAGKALNIEVIDVKCLGTQSITLTALYAESFDSQDAADHEDDDDEAEEEPAWAKAMDDEDDDDGEEEEYAKTTYEIRLTIKGLPCLVVMKVLPVGPLLDFLDPIDQVLDKTDEERRFCQILELMDDTLRLYFVNPDLLEEAELTEVISAPDMDELAESDDD